MEINKAINILVNSENFTAEEDEAIAKLIQEITDLTNEKVKWRIEAK